MTPCGPFLPDPFCDSVIIQLLRYLRWFPAIKQTQVLPHGVGHSVCQG